MFALIHTYTQTHMYTIFTTHQMTWEKLRATFSKTEKMCVCFCWKEQRDEHSHSNSSSSMNNKIHSRISYMVNVCYQQNKSLSGVFCLSHSESLLIWVLDSSFLLFSTVDTELKAQANAMLDSVLEVQSFWRIFFSLYHFLSVLCWLVWIPKRFTNSYKNYFPWCASRMKKKNLHGKKFFCIFLYFRAERTKNDWMFYRTHW